MDLRFIIFLMIWEKIAFHVRNQVHFRIRANKSPNSTNCYGVIASFLYIFNMKVCGILTNVTSVVKIANT